MRNGVDSLRAEHETILAVVDRVEAAARSAVNERLPREYVRATLDFIDVYIDGNHHSKEERVLFVAMEADPFLAGLAGALIADHDEGRRLVAEVERALLDDRPTVAHLLAYAAFIRDHIRRENEMIFDAVESALDESSLAEMDAKCREIEDEMLGPDGAQHVLKQLDAVYVTQAMEQPADRA